MRPRRIIEGTLRTALRLLPASTVVPIVRGPLRGLWWVSGSAPHGVWLDTIERASLRDFSRHVQPRATVWDIGANVGLYSLLASRCVGPAGSVVAFEPAAINVAALRRHAALNRMENIQIVPAAVWNVSGIVRLERGDSRSEFHVSGTGATEVQSVALDAWREEHQETGTGSDEDRRGRRGGRGARGGRRNHSRQPTPHLSCVARRAPATSLRGAVAQLGLPF